jgi:hypothetical protein
VTLRAAIPLACVLIPGTMAAVLVAGRQQPFPHAAHENVAPLCTGCHAGIAEADSGRHFPSPQVCARCHDGAEVARVAWQGPMREPTNVRFDHVVHQRDVVADGTPLACESCHTPEGAGWMVVERAIVPQCLDCHAHEADAHLVDADCSTCHVPLAGTRLTADRVALLPAPPDHALPDFLERVHGQEAEVSVNACAVCHTRERCTSCHVDASVVPAIAAIPAAPHLTLPVWVARYPLPASHREPTFPEQHGGQASVQSCGTCHTRDDCAACHAVDAPAVMGQLATRSRATAPGARIERRPPPSHAAPSFQIVHGTLASTRPTTCLTCHVRTDCEQCHSGGSDGAGALVDGAMTRPPSGRRDTMPAAAVALAVERGRVGTRSVDSAAVRAAGLIHAPRAAAAHATARQEDARAARVSRPEAAYHPPDFALRHSSLAYGRRMECSNCHEPRAFCADCHRQVGMQATGRLGPGFHDAEPLWLLRHGQAARQGLESCASCHRQNDCRQCHSQVGAFRVNPHGPDFDARRAQKRNAAACFLCHPSNPVGDTP